MRACAYTFLVCVCVQNFFSIQSYIHLEEIQSRCKITFWENPLKTSIAREPREIFKRYNSLVLVSNLTCLWTFSTLSLYSTTSNFEKKALRDPISNAVWFLKLCWYLCWETHSALAVGDPWHLPKMAMFWNLASWLLSDFIWCYILSEFALQVVPPKMGKTS